MGASQQPSVAQSEQDLSEALDVDPDEYEWVRQQLESAGIQLQHARLENADDGAGGGGDGDGDGDGDDEDDDDDEDGEHWKDPSEGGALAELLGLLEDDAGQGADDDEQPLLDRVDALLARLAPKNCLSAPGPDGDSALHLAALYGRKAVAERLLAAGADPAAVNPDDGTLALHDAAAGGYDEIVEILLAAGGGGGDGGAQINSPDADGDTPLHCAARGGHLTTVLRLLKAGADASAANEKGCTPRDESDDDKVRALLERVMEGEKGQDAAGMGAAAAGEAEAGADEATPAAAAASL